MWSVTHGVAFRLGVFAIRRSPAHLDLLGKGRSGQAPQIVVGHTQFLSASSTASIGGCWMKRSRAIWLASGHEVPLPVDGKSHFTDSGLSPLACAPPRALRVAGHPNSSTCPPAQFPSPVRDPPHLSIEAGRGVLVGMLGRRLLP